MGKKGKVDKFALSEEFGSKLRELFASAYDQTVYGKDPHYWVGLEEREKTTIVPAHYRLVSTEQDMRDCAEDCRASDVIALDTETNGLYWYAKDFLVNAIGLRAKQNFWMIPTEMRRCENVSRESVRRILGDVLEQSAFVLQKADFDIPAMWRQFGVEIKNIAGDTLIAGWLLDETLPHGLEDMCLRYLDLEDRWKIKTNGHFGMWPIKVAQCYLGGDCENTLKLHRFFESSLSTREKLRSLCHDVEIPHLLNLVEMEKNGIAWDSDYASNVMNPEITKHVEEAERGAREYFGNINFASPQQLAKVLFDDLGLPEINGRSVNKDVLSALKAHHPGIGKLTDFRKYSKAKNAYVDSLPELIGYDGRMHTKFSPIGAVTGRVSCEHPPLQQMPKASVGMVIRRAFVPSPGCVLIAMDFSQIELRLMAHHSQDKQLLLAFQNDLDLHTITAIDVLHGDKAELDKDKDHPVRVTAKNVNFGIPYGIGPVTLCARVNYRLHESGKFDEDLDEEHAQEVIDKWLGFYSGAAALIEDTKIICRRQGYVETLFGRKRRLHDQINSKNYAVKSYAERQAVNHYIQGGAADIMKISVNRVCSHFGKMEWPYRQINEVHDELLLEVDKHWLANHRDTLDTLVELYRTAVELSVPIKVSCDVLLRWGDKVPAEYFDNDAN